MAGLAHCPARCACAIEWGPRPIFNNGALVKRTAGGLCAIARWLWRANGAQRRSEPSHRHRRNGAVKVSRAEMYTLTELRNEMDSLSTLELIERLPAQRAGRRDRDGHRLFARWQWRTSGAASRARHTQRRDQAARGLLQAHRTRDRSTKITS